MAKVRLFAAIAEIAGTRSTEIDGATVGEVLDQATQRYGPEFERLLAYCRVMVNEDQATREVAVAANDELAILPPVSGG